MHIITSMILLLLLCHSETALADETFVLFGLGDSISEGVQSGNASAITQNFSYLNFLASHIGITLNIPMIESGPDGVVGDTSSRSRIDPFKVPTNLAVSGADLNSLLNDRNNATSVDEINSESELVLFPWQGSQMEIAENIVPLLEGSFIICWIGSNDVLSAATSFDRLDASQMTSVEDFQRDFTEIAERLDALDKAVIFANIPNVTQIGFLLDRQDMIDQLGSDYGLQEGDYTTMVAMILIRLDLEDGSLIANHDFVLDSNEIAIIQQRIDAFNQIIEDVAASYGHPVVDVNTLFDTIASNPPAFFDIPVTNRFLGGLFSLDGIHPSNLGHVLLANAFIEKINAHYSIDLPLISEDVINYIFLTDPFVDKDNDGRVAGRFGEGLFETLGPLMGISGDADDLSPDEPLTMEGAENPGDTLMEKLPGYESNDTITTSNFTKKDIIKAFKKIYSTKHSGKPAQPKNILR